MTRLSWKARTTSYLIMIGVLAYSTHYVIFRDPEQLFMSVWDKLAFVFINLTLIAFLIDKLLNVERKVHQEKKLRVISNVFFSEAGNSLLKLLSRADPERGSVRDALSVSLQWSEKDFRQVRAKLRNHSFRIEVGRELLAAVQALIEEKKDFLLRTLENPSLLNKENFTDLVGAVFHVGDELRKRTDLTNLPKSDYEHLQGDLERAYRMLAGEWIRYMQNLQEDYPYLFSLAIRTNPFDENASVVVAPA